MQGATAPPSVLQDGVVGLVHVLGDLGRSAFQGELGGGKGGALTGCRELSLHPGAWGQPPGANGWHRAPPAAPHGHVHVQGGVLAGLSPQGIACARAGGAPGAQHACAGGGPAALPMQSGPPRGAPPGCWAGPEPPTPPGLGKGGSRRQAQPRGRVGPVVLTSKSCKRGAGGSGRAATETQRGESAPPLTPSAPKSQRGWGQGAAPSAAA